MIARLTQIGIILLPLHEQQGAMTRMVTPHTRGNGSMAYNVALSEGHWCLNIVFSYAVSGSLDCHRFSFSTGMTNPCGGM